MGYVFSKLNQRYPLTKFRVFMTDVRDLGSGAVTHYLTSVRKMLAATSKAPKHWRNFDAVLGHYAALSTRQQDLLQAAWVHWLAFTGAELPRLGLGPRTKRGPLAEALRRLVSAFEERGEYPGWALSDMLDFVWRLRPGDDWRVEAMDGEKPVILWREFHYQPALRVVRHWGYPGAVAGTTACQDGALFLPKDPHSDEPMNTATLYRTLDRRSCGETALALDKEARELAESENQRLLLLAESQRRLAAEDLHVGEGGTESSERRPPAIILEP